MSGDKTEACGRCSMTTVVDAAVEEGDHDPFGEERIEVDESEFRRVSPAVWLSGIGRRLNDAVRRLTYGR
jgi:hypothetical protein